MSDYTPTTQEVKIRYVFEDTHSAEFDRWLAEHDRAVAQVAWDKGYNASNSLRLKHEVSIAHDTGGYAWICSCGRRSGALFGYPTERQAHARGDQHLRAASADKTATPVHDPHHCPRGFWYAKCVLECTPPAASTEADYEACCGARDGRHFTHCPIYGEGANRA